MEEGGLSFNCLSEGSKLEPPCDLVFCVKFAFVADPRRIGNDHFELYLQSPINHDSVGE
jgi:hypothetical protein